MKFAIDLDKVFENHKEFCSYEAEVFPGKWLLISGLVYRMIEPKIVLLIFVSGKLVLTGAKKKSDIDQAFQNIFPILVDAKKKRVNESTSRETLN